MVLCPDMNKNVTTDSGQTGQTHHDSFVKIAKTTQPSTIIQSPASDHQQQEFSQPKITLSVPDAKLTHTFDFILSKRFKFILIIVLTGTTIFITFMIVLGYWLNKRFYDEIIPPCGLLPCPSSTEPSPDHNFV